LPYMIALRRQGSRGSRQDPPGCPTMTPLGRRGPGVLLKIQPGIIATMLKGRLHRGQSSNDRLPGAPRGAPAGHHRLPEHTGPRKPSYHRRVVLQAAGRPQASDPLRQIRNGARSYWHAVLLPEKEIFGVVRRDSRPAPRSPGSGPAGRFDIVRKDMR